MEYISEKTSRGNVGVSRLSQEDADNQARKMDEQNCQNCRDCGDCQNCWGCRDSRGCYFAENFVGCLCWTPKTTITGTPLCLNGLYWPVTILQDRMQIGCQHHLIEDWARFSDEEIAGMNVFALEFWKRYKEFLLGVCTYAAKVNQSYPG